MLIHENLLHPDTADQTPDLEQRRSRLLSAYNALRFRMEAQGFALPENMRRRLFAKADKLDDLDRIWDEL